MQIRTKNNAWGYMIPKYLSDSSISNKSSFFFFLKQILEKIKIIKINHLKKIFLKMNQDYIIIIKD